MQPVYIVDLHEQRMLEALLPLFTIFFPVFLLTSLVSWLLFDNIYYIALWRGVIFGGCSVVLALCWPLCWIILHSIIFQRFPVREFWVNKHPYQKFVTCAILSFLAVFTFNKLFSEVFFSGNGSFEKIIEDPYKFIAIVIIISIAMLFTFYRLFESTEERKSKPKISAKEFLVFWKVVAISIFCFALHFLASWTYTLSKLTFLKIPPWLGFLIKIKLFYYLSPNKSLGGVVVSGVLNGLLISGILFMLPFVKIIFESARDKNRPFRQLLDNFSPTRKFVFVFLISYMSIKIIAFESSNIHQIMSLSVNMMLFSIIATVAIGKIISWFLFRNQ